MTLEELEQIVEEAKEWMDPTAQVRFISQPNRPMEYTISSNNYAMMEADPGGGHPEALYLAEDTQVGYLRDGLRDELGWY